jgi:hypothetical protein
MSDDIVIEDLKLVQVSGDGKAVRITARTADGSLSSLILPSSAARQLLMTLPRVITKAIAVEHKDDSLRLAFPLQTWRIERSVGTDLMLTLTTAGNFEITFSLGAERLQELETTLASESTTTIEAPIRLN